VAGATTTAGRLALAFGEPLKAGADQPPFWPSILFPTPASLVDAPIETVGVVGSRASAIRALAAAILSADVSFDNAQDPEAFVESLTAIKGIGSWTAQYLSMRVLKNPDAFPDSDLGLLKAIRPGERLKPAELKARSEPWRPWRAYAAMLLWQNPDSSGG
jgi:AraC family transcriptional regulator of adaptative response / DNA-3-methyladenine glycosylase II